MSSMLWEKDNYRPPTDILLDGWIREYDITKANISILTDLGILQEVDYQRLLSAPKIQREIEIGNLQGRSSDVSKALKDGFTQARRAFVEYNNLEDTDIFSIKKDAIYVIGNKPIITQQVSPHVNFRLASQYTSFMRIKYLELYYLYDTVSQMEVLEVKGIGDRGVADHNPYMIDFLKELFYTAQIQGPQKAILLLNSFYSQYISLQLPIEYYRSFDARSMYCFKPFGYFGSYGATILDPRISKNALDISYNESILRILQTLIGSIMIKTTRL